MPASSFGAPKPGLAEEFLGVADGDRSTGLQKELAFYAQKLGKVPILVAASRSRQGFVNRYQSLVGLSRLAQAIGELAEKHREIDAVLHLPQLVQTSSQRGQSVFDIAALDLVHALEAATPRLPKAERIPLRIIEQHRHEGSEALKIANEDRDRAPGLNERLTISEGVVARFGLRERVFDSALSLIGESLQP